ncbi:MAG: sulfate adenylyltransferase subunit CysD [Alphaproteobacteria bacterium]|nr:sulfate adenylyltransferase subunit CysD [Alphaproteobacteria bacterium]
MSLLADDRRQARPAETLRGHLESLESEAIYILREVGAQFERPALLFSGGKDSAVVLHLAIKAFAPGPMPFTLLHIDTGHNYPEVLAFRDAAAVQAHAKLVVRKVEDSIAAGRVVLKHPGESRNAHQSVTLLDAIDEFHFDACIGGARRDEEKARAKERVFSFRDSFGGWQPRRQRPELWNLFQGRVDAGEHMRVFPLSNWTEADIWRLIARQGVALPPLYFAHDRDVVERGELLVPHHPLIPLRRGESPVRRRVRFRTVGDITCTCPVASVAETPEEVLAETLAAELSERGATRLDDAVSEVAMERRKLAGYF